MPLPLLFIAIAAATGAVGVGKSVKAVVDTHDAKKTNEKANEIVNRAKDRLESMRKKCGSDLKLLGTTKIRILDSSVNHFVQSFGKLKNVSFKDSAGLNEMRKFCIDSKDFEELKALGGFATNIIGGILSGAMGGALTAFGAYSAAGSLAVASTGTAIASLSGAAATNATLAFFGGGSLAAGGLGIAGGTMVLGGLIAGPALAIMGFIVGAKASSAKDEAYSNLAKAKLISEELGTASDLCQAISKKCNLFINLLHKLDNYFKPFITKIDEAITEHGTDYRSSGQEQKQATAAAASIAKAIKMVLDTPILDDNGNLTKESDETLKQIKPDKIATGFVTAASQVQQSSGYEPKELSVNEIMNICKYNVSHRKNHYANCLEEFAQIKWDKLISHVNSSYGMNCTANEYASYIDKFGERSPIRISDLFYGLSNFIHTYQLSVIVEACVINHSLSLREEDIDWDKLIHKISVFYGVAIAKWQLFHHGINQIEDVLKQIEDKVICSAGDDKKLYFVTSEFKALMLK